MINLSLSAATPEKEGLDWLEVVCGVIEDGAGRVLACRRAAARVLGGQWEFPGGKREVGESLEQALARELAEELDTDQPLVIGEWLAQGELASGARPIRLSALRVSLAEGETGPRVRAGEHEEARWLRADELETVAWAEADWPIVARWREICRQHHSGE